MLLNDIAGYNANRKIFDDGADIGDEIDGARGMLDIPSFQIAVVVDVFFDPANISDELKQELTLETATPELYSRMPRNSIAGRIITRNQDLYDSSPRIFFPVNVFDAEPVKPGEQVFVFFVDPIVNDQIGYWWKRVPQPIDTDDLNFTHSDRKYQANEGTTSTEKLAGKEPANPDFINGGDQAPQYTISGGPAAYENINKKASANSAIVKEPVARFVKRPGDKVIMGSNSARIVLGMDRAGTSPTPASAEVRPKSATIDLVVGYGREDTPTAPTVVSNSRGDQEVDKRPTTPDNSQEGDPDLQNDKSRLYISESTDVDANFEIDIDGVPATTGMAAAHAVRSDRIRFDAREDLKLKAGDTAFVIDAQGNVKVVSPNGNVNLGSANPALGVARMTDDITIDITTDSQFIQFQAALFSFMTAVGNALQGLGVPGLTPQSFGVSGPPTTIGGTISSASDKVYSE